MNKFTKGPWYLSKPKGEHRALVMAGELRICTVAYNSGKTHVNSNAAMIAAAPDLYEALESAVMAVNADIIQVRPSDREAFLGMLTAWNKALAKARGEA